MGNTAQKSCDRCFNGSNSWIAESTVTVIKASVTRNVFFNPTQNSVTDALMEVTVGSQSQLLLPLKHP